MMGIYTESVQKSFSFLQICERLSLGGIMTMAKAGFLCNILSLPIHLQCPEVKLIHVAP